MSDEEIYQPESPLAVPTFKFSMEFFERTLDQTLWHRIRSWVSPHYPDVLFLADYTTRTHNLYFKTRELYIEFCKAFPEVLRGSDDHT